MLTFALLAPAKRKQLNTIGLVYRQTLPTQTPARPERCATACGCSASPAPVADRSCGTLTRVLLQKCRHGTRAGALTQAETADLHVHMQPSSGSWESVPARTCEHLPREQGQGGSAVPAFGSAQHRPSSHHSQFAVKLFLACTPWWPHGIPVLAQCKVATVRGDAGCLTAFWVHWDGHSCQFSMLFPLGFLKNRLLPPHFQPSTAACPDPAG